jgi:hypothetical protein
MRIVDDSYATLGQSRQTPDRSVHPAHTAPQSIENV